MTEKSKENITRSISFSFEEDPKLKSLYERLKRTCLDKEPSQEFLKPTDLIVKSSDLWNLIRILYIDVEDESNITEENITNNVRKIFQECLTKGVPIGEAFLPLITYFPEIMNNMAEMKKSFYLHLIGPTYTGKTFTSLSVLSSLLTMYVKTVMDLRNRIHESKTRKNLKDFFNMTIMPLLKTVDVTEENFDVDKYISKFMGKAWKLSMSPNAPKLESFEYLRNPILDYEILETLEAFHGVINPPKRMGILNDIFIKTPEAFKRFPYGNIFYNSDEKAGLLIFTHNGRDKMFREIFLNSYGQVLTSIKYVCERSFSRFGVFIPVSNLDRRLENSGYLSRVWDAIDTILNMMAYENMDRILSSDIETLRREVKISELPFIEYDVQRAKNGLSEVIDSILKAKYGDEKFSKIRANSGEYNKLRANEWKSLKGIFDELLSRNFGDWVDKLEYERAGLYEYELRSPLHIHEKLRFSHVFDMEVFHEINNEISESISKGEVERTAFRRFLGLKEKIRDGLSKLNNGLIHLFYANALNTHIEEEVPLDNVSNGVKVRNMIETIAKRIEGFRNGKINKDVAYKTLMKEFEYKNIFELMGLNKDDFKSLDDFEALLNKDRQEILNSIAERKKKLAEENSKTIRNLFGTLYRTYKAYIEGNREYEELFELIETEMRFSPEMKPKILATLGEPGSLISQAINRRHICEIAPKGVSEYGVILLPSGVMISRDSMLADYSLEYMIDMIHSMSKYLSPDAYRSHAKYLLVSMIGFDPVILPALFEFFELL